MKSFMKKITVISFLLFIVFIICNFISENGVFLTLAITFGTITYHFGMRLIVGFIVDKIMNNKADYTKKRFQTSKFEMQIYEVIRVKSWKNKMPTYDPDLFSLERHTWDEIAQAMCQAEIVHEIIMVMSYLPIIASVFLGEFPVFLITSICASLLDLSFVIMQRYNRPRVVRIARKYKDK